MSFQNSQINGRLVFEKAFQVIKDAGLTLDETQCTKSDLILEEQLTTTQTLITYAPLVNNNGPSGTRFNTEIRLNQQDSFVANCMGFFLLPAASATDAAFIAHTYPSPVPFTGTGVAAALETLYNSMLKITVNNRVVLPVWSMSRHRMVPQSQQVAAATNQNGIAQDQIDLSNDGFDILEPLILFIGSKNNLIELSLPASLAAIGSFTRSRLHFRGVLAQNSTVIT